MRIKTAIVFSLIASLGLISPVMAEEDDDGGGMDGKSLAFDRKKGNCLACHAIPSEPKVESPGTIGPPLANIKDRYDRAELRARIWDETVANPDTVMPPFGRNKILTEEELDAVTDYIMTL